MSPSFDHVNNHLGIRHIQDEHNAKALKHYWGYPDRVIPCTNDPGSCAYLDGVYWMHTVSMLYTFILWAVIGGLLAMFILFRLFKPSRIPIKVDHCSQPRQRQGFLYRVWRTSAAASHKYLLPESLGSIFGHTTKLQILILSCLLVYLLIFSLVGIVYKTWVTPIKNSTRHNIRTGLGGFGDRVGALAYALTPLTIGLSTRDSILSLLTGIPYIHFNFLHRWTGRIIFIQSFLHTLSWTIVEGKLYQPQPTVYKEFISETYIIWGVIAQLFITFLYIFSTQRAIRWTGYEFFRKSHFLIAGLYLGACWAHWSKLACWMIASLGVLGIDLGCRILRVCLIHCGYKDGNKGLGFRSINAHVESYTDASDAASTILRISFSHNHLPWKIGQHFFVTFTALNIWQSHPFTPASVPTTALRPPQHVYIVRARKGETGRLAVLATSAETAKDGSFQTPLILMGPYGQHIIDTECANILAIAGGTGISFTLPVAMASHAQNVCLVWCIRHIENLLWILPELEALKARLPPLDACSNEGKEQSSCGAQNNIPKGTRLHIQIYVTRDASSHRNATHRTGEKDLENSSTSSKSSKSSSPHESRLSQLLQPHPNFTITYLKDHHPSISKVVGTFIAETVDSGRVQVVSSGPASLGTDVRAAVARCNDARKVWEGDESGDVECVWDDRMG